MKNIYLIIILSLLVVNCEKKEKQKLSLDDSQGVKEISERSTQEKTNKNFKKDQYIATELLKTYKNIVHKPLFMRSLLKETSNYNLIQASDNGTDIRNYFLLSISKKNGEVSSLIELGQETEGVEPFKINWKSQNTFSTIDYKFKFVEDPESGAYMKGALEDSIIHNYEVNSIGIIKELSEVIE